MSTDENEDGLWLFGYGSLIWKPPPHFDRRLPGYVEGYVRRFWQASEDHRGTPEAPGRVVTLIPRSHWESLTDHHPSAPPKTWGAAYHIPREHVEEVKSYLDIREINGYSVDFAAFHIPVLILSQAASANGSPGEKAAHVQAPIKCLVYIGMPDNPQFVGPEDPAKLAAHIVRSKGPSGENKDYLYSLAAALEQIREEAGVEVEVDDHVNDIARRARLEEVALR